MAPVNSRLWFLENGVGVFPIKDGSKEPACPSWDDFSCTPARAAGFKSYGVRLGLLGVLDTDEPAAEEWARAHAPATAFMVDTARGVHRYYRLVRADAPHYVHQNGLTMEFRHSGQYVIGPDSIHPSGVRYAARTWSWRIEDVPIFPVETFAWDDRPMNERGVTAGGASFALPAMVCAGERHEVMFRLLRSLQLRGLSVDAAIATCHVENAARCRPPITPTELERYLRRSSRLADRPDVVRRVGDPRLLICQLFEAGLTADAVRVAVQKNFPDFEVGHLLDVGGPEDWTEDEKVEVVSGDLTDTEVAEAQDAEWTDAQLSFARFLDEI